MERVEDPELLKTILDIINKMIGLEAAAKIDIVLVTGLSGLGRAIVYRDKERHWGSCKSYFHVLVDIKVKPMLKNEEEKEIVCAMLAHEIGHTMTCKDQYFEIEEEPLYILEWEIESDKKALMLLGNIYDNPKEILKKQIDYVHHAVLEYENATSEDIFMTGELAEKRRNALLEN